MVFLFTSRIDSGYKRRESSVALEEICSKFKLMSELSGVQDQFYLRGYPL